MLSLFLCLSLSVVLVSSQGTGSACPVDESTIDIEEIIHNPPKQWSFECMTKELLDEFISVRSRVENVFECLQSFDLCKAAGYELIAEELLNRIGAGGVCFNCGSKRLQELARYGAVEIRARYPKIYRRGLQILG